MLTGFSNNLFAYDFKVGGIAYYYWQEYNKDNELVVVGVTVAPLSNSEEYSGDIVIPSNVSYMGTSYNVVGIDGKAFSGCENLTSVEIPNTVTFINSEAFDNCKGLTSIEIPNSITSIGHKAFFNCTGLLKVTIGSGCTYISIDAFEYCNNLSLVFCDAVTPPEMDSYEFPYSVIIVVPKESVGSYKSTNYWGLYTVTDLYDTTNGFTFYGLSDTTVSIVSTANYGTVVIPSSISYDGTNYTVTRIRTEAFYNDSTITEVTIPETIDTIESRAFMQMSALKTVNYNAKNAYVGKNILTYGTQGIHTSMFPFCKNLENVNIGNTVEAIPDYFLRGGVFFHNKENVYDSSYTVDMCFHKISSLTIPTNVKSIGEKAFDQIPDLITLNYNAINAKSKYRTFYGDTLLANVNIGESVECIPDNFLYGQLEIIKQGYEYDGTTGTIKYNPIDDTIDNRYKKLTSITIPSSVKYIGEHAFHNTRLTELTIPENVDTIKADAFAEITSLTKVNFNAKNAEFFGYVFRGDSLLSEVNIGEGVISIPNSFLSGENLGYAFTKGFDKITEIVIPSTVKRIGDMAFYFCTNLTKVNIPDGIKYIGYSAFQNCNLDTITIPESIDILESGAFANNYNAKVLNYNVSNASEVFSAFDNDTNITVVNIGNNVEELPDIMFKNLHINSITLPNVLKTIGEKTFKGCKYLKTINIPENVEQIGELAFAGCTSLDTVIYNAVDAEYIYSNEASMFDGDTNLSVFIIGNKVENIPARILQGRELGYNPYGDDYDSYKFISKFKKLTKIILPNSVKVIGESAFSECEGLKYLEIGSNVSKIDKKAFAFCENMDTIVLYAEVPPTIYNSTFEEVLNIIPVFVPCGTMNTYKSAAWWNMFTNYIEVGCNKEIVTSNIAASICDGDIYDFNGEELTVAGTYTDTVHVNVDKDSVIILTLTVNPTYNVSAEETRVLEDLTVEEYDEIVIDTLQSKFGCDSIVTTTIHYKHDNGINDANYETTISVYPNPARDKVTIKTDGEVSIFNNKGQVVKFIRNVKGIKEINISDLKSGVYYVKSGGITKKLIIE